MSINASGIVPQGHRVLVLPDQISDKTESGIVIFSPTQLEREQLGQTEGVVVSLGKDAYSDYSSAWCTIGDKVIIARYAGMMRTGNDGLSYRIISDTDVVALLDNKGTV
jgi:co-chaperonin GroES (HSP10)